MSPTPQCRADRLPTPRPRGPLLSWSALCRRDAPAPLGLHRLPARHYASSGRAALQLALRTLGLAPGSAVLVPTYHCPTMIAPVVALGLVARFYAIGDDGLPQLAAIDVHAGPQPRALIVAHLFDRARSLRDARAWCDQHGIAMIEDCAHAPLGMAGERPVGHWGDLATASLSKFAPVPEMGLLGSANPGAGAPRLRAAGLTEQIKGAWTVLDRAAPHRRPAGLHPLVRWLDRLRSRSDPMRPEPAPVATEPVESRAMMAACDMSRADQAPTWVARALAGSAFGERAAATRRANQAALLAAVEGAPGVRPLFPRCPDDAAPYATALWIDRADPVYEGLRRAGDAVYRWDRVWPGTPELADDRAPAWRRHVLQCLCHQDLSTADMQALGLRIRQGWAG